MYLIQLADRVAKGLTKISAERTERHRRFLLSQQTDSGGFKGREGDADLYYTGFAARALAVSGGLDPVCCRKLAKYLRTIDPLKLGVIDLLSWLYSALVVQTSGGIDLLAGLPADFVPQVIALIEANRTSDGGYAKSNEGALGSTYQSFLVALT